MKELRPEHKPYTLAEFTRKCFDPGFTEFCMGELGFTEQDIVALINKHSGEEKQNG